MEGEFVEMGKLIGAGLACTGMGGAAVGVGHVVGNFLSGALRNPNAAAGQTATMFIGIAFAEALGIFSFLASLKAIFSLVVSTIKIAPGSLVISDIDPKFFSNLFLALSI